MVVMTALAIVMMSFVMLVPFVVAAAFVFFVVVVTTFAVMFRHSDSMLGVDVRGLLRCIYSLLCVSIKMVTGPSLRRVTCISAPNSPVPTGWLKLWLSWAMKYS